MAGACVEAKHGGGSAEEAGHNAEASMVTFLLEPFVLHAECADPSYRLDDP